MTTFWRWEERGGDRAGDKDCVGNKAIRRSGPARPPAPPAEGADPRGLEPCVSGSGCRSAAGKHLRVGPREAACKQSRAGMVGGWGGAAGGEQGGLPGSGPCRESAAGRGGDQTQASEIKDWCCTTLINSALLSHE